MAEHKPLLGFFGKNAGKTKEQKRNDKIKEALDQQAEQRRHTQDITATITEIQITLNRLNSQYGDIFKRELRTARRNAAKGKKDKANYSRIGIAFYSKQIVEAALQRVEELDSTYGINTAMNELSSALNLVNALPGVVGKTSARDIVKSVNKMNGTAGGGGGDLASVLSAISALPTDGISSSSVEGLVSMAEIEKWINDSDYASQCLEDGTGGELDRDEILDAAANLAKPQVVEETEGGAAEAAEEPVESFDRTLEELRHFADSL